MDRHASYPRCSQAAQIGQTVWRCRACRMPVADRRSVAPWERTVEVMTTMSGAESAGSGRAHQLRSLRPRHLKVRRSSALAGEERTGRGHHREGLLSPGRGCGPDRRRRGGVGWAGRGGSHRARHRAGNFDASILTPLPTNEEDAPQNEADQQDDEKASTATDRAPRSPPAGDLPGPGARQPAAVRARMIRASGAVIGGASDGAQPVTAAARPYSVPSFAEPPRMLRNASVSRCRATGEMSCSASDPRVDTTVRN